MDAEVVRICDYERPPAKKQPRGPAEIIILPVMKREYVFATVTVYEIPEPWPTWNMP